MSFIYNSMDCLSRLSGFVLLEMCGHNGESPASQAGVFNVGEQGHPAAASHFAENLVAKQAGV